MNVLDGQFEQRLRKSISFAWNIFTEKVGTGMISINKEASMQLHYASILLQVVQLICYEESEHVTVELETSEEVNGKRREIDLILCGSNSRSGSTYRIVVEMKCYRTLASSGGKRGAPDIFMKDVYEDLHLLEAYCDQANYDRAVALVMTDMEALVYPTKKEGKRWDYDISQGTKISDVHLQTPIGGKDIDIRLLKSYEFDWIKKGRFWFLESEGH